MATYTIQNGPFSDSNAPSLHVGSNGTLYSVYRYTLSSTHYLTVAYSTDNGATWTEVKVVGTGIALVQSAIDSVDNIHIVYFKNSTTIGYRVFSGGAIGSEETYTVTAVSSSDEGICIAIDKFDIPHIAWQGSNTHIYYSNRSSGTWAAETSLEDNFNGVEGPHDMVIDGNGYIYIIYNQANADDDVMVIKYTTSWQTPLQIGTVAASIDSISAVVDSSNNVHVVYSDGSANLLRYVKYTAGTDTWAAQTSIVSSSIGGNPVIGIDTSDTLYVFYYNDSNNIALISNNGSWSSTSEIIDEATSVVPISSKTVRWPMVNAVRTQIPSAGYYLLFINNTSLKIHTSSGWTLQTPVTKNYTKDDRASLPTEARQLDTYYTSTGYSNVATDDGVRENQTATDQYAIHHFRNRHTGNSDTITVNWNGQSTVAPSSSTVYLQIYNITDATWETLASNNAAAANTDFTLSGVQSTNLSKYYNGQYWVSFRVYQLAA